MIRDLFKDMLGYLPAQIIPGIAAIIFLPIITRLFSPEEYGIYTLVLATASVLAVVSGWLNMAVIRFYPASKEDDNLKEFFSSIYIWLAISVFILASCFFLVTFVLKNSLSTTLYNAMLVGVLLYIALAVFSVIQNTLRAQRMINWYTVSSIWKSLSGIGLGILLIIALNQGVNGLLWGSVLGMAAAIPLLWIISTREVRFGIKDFSLKLSKDMAKYSFPLMVGNLAAWILSLTDRYIIEIYRGSFEVGLYSISYRLSEFSILLATSLFTLAFNPLSIIIWEGQGEKKGRIFLERGTRLYIVLCLPIVVVLSVLQKPVVGILSTQEYWPGAVILPWVTSGLFFLGLSERFGAGLSFKKRTVPSMLCIFAAALINIVLNLIFIPRYGFKAAAVTTTTSYGLLLLLMIIVSRKYFRWSFPFGTLIRVCIASAVMGLAVWAATCIFNLSNIVKLVAGIPVGIIVYSMSLILLREIKPDEKKALKSIVAQHLPDRLTPKSWK